MPPQLRRAPFGDYELVTLGTADTHVSFVPAASGYVHALSLGGRAVLAGYADGAALRRNRGDRNIALLPFPNRLHHGRYTWLAREHAFAVNHPASESALHGYRHEAPFALAAVDLGAEWARARLRFLNAPGRHPGGYPFAVLFELTLALDTAAPALTWSLSARNLGPEPAPVGLGWHPYFRVPGGLGAWRLSMPPNDTVVLAGGIPTGERVAGLPAGPLAIDTRWDSCFALADPLRRVAELRGPDYGLRFEQDGDTRYTQLYVPPTHTALAVEPMSCGVDAFRQNQAEVRVAPGRHIECGMRIALV